MANILLDLNSPVFQKDLFSLSKEDAYSVLNTLKKISKMDWELLYRYQGLKWELIYSKKGNNGENIYSFRINKKFRATALRDGNYLRVLSLHLNHDSTYK
ncbi:hypothetical protein A5482_015190 (plasmid) [Cyanobacterium sp. IPPAS B-1200]|uniref:hypothetical protein n=1 Tax=Cyanobacterium sp. IPPAS B-1200 TaxID=1562720 RepID=UPI0008525AB3|nr:hypothetical protein [Cyanobacterium sp. IPPAS B-1200]OEJ78450.1 hypothetical protein A5482_13190 [Cyanobacterium sp. IPPAS B-1200]